MSTAELRLSLIEKIPRVSEATLAKMIELVRKEEKDWWDELSEEDKASIQRGLQQAKSGQFVSHQEAMEVFSKWQ